MQTAFDALGSPNRIDLHVEARGNWWEARPASPWLAMAEAAISKEWGVEPLYVREGEGGRRKGARQTGRAQEDGAGAPFSGGREGVWTGGNAYLILSGWTRP